MQLIVMFVLMCSVSPNDACVPQELAWKAKEPEERKINFIPKKFSSFRLITAYPRFCNERFERCLDLYLCPRQRKMRVGDGEDESG